MVNGMTSFGTSRTHKYRETSTTKFCGPQLCELSDARILCTPIRMLACNAGNVYEAKKMKVICTNGTCFKLFEKTKMLRS